MTQAVRATGWGSRTLLLAASVALAAPGMAATREEQRVAELERKLEASLKTIEALSARLGELERANSQARDAAAGQAAARTLAANASEAASAAAASAAQAASRADAVESNLAQLQEASQRSAAVAGVPLHGFMDVGYVQSNRKPADGRKSGFTLGNVDFYLTPEFGDRFKSLIELNFEYGEDGTLNTDLERMQFGYTFDNNMTLWAGRFHTPYGYWNTAFHHGAQIQTSIARPRMVGFEDQGGILPAHTVGLWLTGTVAAGDGRIGYDAYAGNGPRLQAGVIDYQPVRDDNGNKLVGGAVTYRFGGAADGLVLGVHGMQANFNDNRDGGTPAAAGRLRMTGAFGYFDNDDWEVIGEYYRFNDANRSGTPGAFGSWAGFMQAGRNLDAGVTAYVRWEKASLNVNDNYFRGLESGTSYSRQAVGLRYSLNPKAALKFELMRTDDAREGRSNEAQVQAAIRF